jgi:CBS domain-containing protein
MAEATLHLSSIAGCPLVDADGHRLGRVEDVIVRLDLGDGLPPVTGLRARIGGRQMFVPVDRISKLEPGSTRTATTKLNLGQFERRPGEVLLRHDLLGRSLINVQTAQLVTAREVELTCEDGVWRVAGVDSSFGAGVRRHLPRALRREPEDEATHFVAWTDLEPFVGHVPSSRLRLKTRRLARLHPAQIADLVEAASHEEGEEIMQAVGQDKELEADVFEELDEEHQLEFLRERSDAEVAAVMARMASDDAADLLLEIDQERRLPVLELMPAGKQRKIRDLLGYNPGTAGGLMNPDFLAVDDDATAADALAAVRASQLSPAELSTVHVTGADGAFVGSVPLAAIARAGESQPVAQLVGESPPVIAADADLPEIARRMTDYNLHSLPVVDHDGRMIGVLAVDDVLELLLPSDWRRRYGIAREG